MAERLPIASRKDFEEFGKKRLKEALARTSRTGKKIVLVAGFLDPYGDCALSHCSICNVPVWVRPWMLEAIMEHNIKVHCICCADSFPTRARVAMDFDQLWRQLNEAGQGGQT